MKKKRRNILRKKKKEIDILQDQFSIVFFHKFSWDWRGWCFGRGQKDYSFMSFLFMFYSKEKKKKSLWWLLSIDYSNGRRGHESDLNRDFSFLIWSNDSSKSETHIFLSSLDFTPSTKFSWACFPKLTEETESSKLYSKAGTRTEIVDWEGFEYNRPLFPIFAKERVFLPSASPEIVKVCFAFSEKVRIFGSHSIPFPWSFNLRDESGEGMLIVIGRDFSPRQIFVGRFLITILSIFFFNLFF